MILWTGGKHTGKTTAAAALVEAARGEGFSVAGILAPSIYRDTDLVGFDVVDLRTGHRAPLLEKGSGTFFVGGADDSVRPDDPGHVVSGNPPPKKVPDPFFFDEGRALGAEALSPESTRSADLVVVDEFGPLELAGGGWRRAVDTLVRSAGGLVLLVVRDGKVAVVRELYPLVRWTEVRAADPPAVETVVEMLRVRLQEGRRNG